MSIKNITCLDGPNEGAISVTNTVGGRPGYRYALDDENFGPAANWAGLSAGAYTVRVRDAANCELSLPATLLGPPELLADLGPDLSINLGDSIQLFVAVNSPNVTFNWTHQPGLNQAEVWVRPVESGIYLVSVMDTLTFCETEDYLRITVDRNRRVYIPNVFTPDGDGANDFFFIHSANDVVNVKSISIFSRSGQLVFQRTNIQTNDFSQGWDGMFRGQLLNPATFVYVTEIEFYDGKTEVFKGDVTLLR